MVPLHFPRVWKKRKASAAKADFATSLTQKLVPSAACGALTVCSRTTLHCRDLVVAFWTSSMVAPRLAPPFMHAACSKVWRERTDTDVTRTWFLKFWSFNLAKLECLDAFGWPGRHLPDSL